MKIDYLRKKILNKVQKGLSMETNDDFVIIDVKDIILKYNENLKYYTLYNLFPLRDIISSILIVPIDGGDQEQLWIKTEEVIDKNTNINFCIDDISDFYLSLTTDLDERLKTEFPNTKDYMTYRFHRWLDDTSIVMVGTYEPE